jgi:hypothetical protein
VGGSSGGHTCRLRAPAVRQRANAASCGRRPNGELDDRPQRLDAIAAERLMIRTHARPARRCIESRRARFERSPASITPRRRSNFPSGAKGARFQAWATIPRRQTHLFHPPAGYPAQAVAPASGPAAATNARCRRARAGATSSSTSVPPRPPQGRARPPAGSGDAPPRARTSTTIIIAIQELVATYGEPPQAAAGTRPRRSGRGSCDASRATAPVVPAGRAGLGKAPVRRIARRRDLPGRLRAG